MGRTLRDDMAADAASTFLNQDEFAEAAVHWPKGEEAEAVAVAVLFEERAVERRTEFGDRTVREISLWVPATLSLDKSDRWVARGSLCQTQEIGEANGGLVEVKVRRDEKLTTRTGAKTLKGSG